MKLHELIEAKKAFLRGEFFAVELRIKVFHRSHCSRDDRRCHSLKMEKIFVTGLAPIDAVLLE